MWNWSKYLYIDFRYFDPGQRKQTADLQGIFDKGSLFPKAISLLFNLFTDVTLNFGIYKYMKDI